MSLRQQVRKGKMSAEALLVRLAKQRSPGAARLRDWVARRLVRLGGRK